VLGQATGNSRLTRLTMAQTWGSHHLPQYSILCAFPRHPHPNGFLFWDTQGGVPKLLRFGLLQLCGNITLCSDLGSRWGLKQSCSSCQELFNGVSHSTCTHRGQVDSRLSVVRSQIAILWLLVFLLARISAADVQMAQKNPFSTSTLQYLSNDVKNAPMRGVLTLAIEL
jgi:hypothetical protein